MLERIVCLAVGYVLGLFQTSYIYGRKQGIDIREHGSGNAGTTNAFRTMGKKAGALTLLGDILKCVSTDFAGRYFKVCAGDGDRKAFVWQQLWR